MNGSGSPATAPWHTRHSDTVVATRWLQVRRDSVTRPDGADDVYDHVVLPGSVTVLAVAGDGTVPVTRQWIYTHRERQWRLPAGGLDPGDADPATAARRELAEETGLTAGSWRSLGTVNGADSVTNHRDHVFLATGLEPGTPHLGPGEADLEVHWLPFQRVLGLVLAGHIRHAGSTFAVLTAAMAGLAIRS